MYSLIGVGFVTLQVLTGVQYCVRAEVMLVAYLGYTFLKPLICRLGAILAALAWRWLLAW
jgi:hypothetical protein